VLPQDLYGPWEVEGYQVRIDFTGRAHLVASRNGTELKALPPVVRESDERAWIDQLLEAARRHQGELRTLLEAAMVEGILLSDEDLAALALDPAGRPMLGALLMRMGGAVGRPLTEEWLLETLGGDLLRLAGPVTVVHPVDLHLAGTLEAWDRWYNRAPLRQPFKQIRREIYLPNAQDRESRTFSDRFAGEVVRWDQARALLEGRGWHRVTKTGAEKRYQRARLHAVLEFRTPVTRGFLREDVMLSRVYLLRAGEQAGSRANPGLPVTGVPPVLFSETLRDTGLVARVASRRGAEP
jgi:hypothetical protein